MSTINNNNNSNSSSNGRNCDLEKSDVLLIENGSTNNDVAVVANYYDDNNNNKLKEENNDQCDDNNNNHQHSDDDNEKTKTNDNNIIIISKNQLKKKRRIEHCMERKRRRKEQDKLVKIEKAKKEQIDIQLIREKQKEVYGINKYKRIEKWNNIKLSLLKSSFQIIIDCYSYKQINIKNLKSLAMQIRYTYSINKKHIHPCQINITNCNVSCCIDNSNTTNCTSISNNNNNNNNNNQNDNNNNNIEQQSTTTTTSLRDILQKVSGYEEWCNYGINITEQSIEQAFLNNNNNNNDNKSNSNNLIYLTTSTHYSDDDATKTTNNILYDLDDTKIYILAGIVDRNRIKINDMIQERVTKQLNGIPVLQIPIPSIKTTTTNNRALSINHIVHALLQYRQTKDWNITWQQVLQQQQQK